MNERTAGGHHAAIRVREIETELGIDASSEDIGAVECPEVDHIPRLGGGTLAGLAHDWPIKREDGR